MRLVQTYNTFGGEKRNAGFSSKRSLFKFWNDALEVHSKNYDVTVYTDEEGYEYIHNKINAKIEIIDFELIDDRFFNIGKFQVHLEQNEPYLMVDVDVILYDKITKLDSDVYCEMIRGGHNGLYCNHFNIRPTRIGIPCSGLLGFRSPEFAKKYASSAIEKIKNVELDKVTFDAMWHIEEVYLANLIEDNNLSVKTFEKFTHLQGGKK
ncbi:MAG: hypothetical protein PF481_06880 [Bacteroidales bacterium]|jgi:hypothetical protein|nr:hypothetical protein [Bacteroidales bacterium]